MSTHNEQPSTAPGTRASGLTSLGLTNGTALPVPLDEQAALDRGRDVAQAGATDPAWGDNRSRTTQERNVAAGEVAENLAVIAYQADVRAHADAASTHAAAHATERAVVATHLSELRDALAEKEGVRRDAATAGFPEPRPTPRSDRRVAGQVGVAVLLAVADVFLTAPAFDNLGLSDSPLVGGLGWADERHVAALGVVVSILLLSIVLGWLLPRAAYRTGLRLRQTFTQPTVTPAPAGPPEEAP